jgi:hypothetical protein
MLQQQAISCKLFFGSEESSILRTRPCSLIRPEFSSACSKINEEIGDEDL